MRRAARFGLPLAIAIVVVAGVGTAVFTAVAPRLAQAHWDLDIERAMDAAGVAPGMVVGEAGAGDGYFTLPMARRVGPAGAVYANDISRRQLDSLAANARRDGLTNVHVVEGAVDDPLFPRKDLELVVVVHAFHDFSQPVEWLVNLKKYLRPGGVVAIVDVDPSQGDRDRHFWPRERILEYAAGAGYEKSKLVDDISRHLIIVLKPRAATEPAERREPRVQVRPWSPPAYALARPIPRRESAGEASCIEARASAL
jgi:ubiquinone/menaquinone biosynthesis C-methylase UbiE